MRILPVLLLCVLLLVSSPAPAWQIDLTPEEQSWLKDHRDSLVLGFDWKYPPLEFQDDDGTYRGMSADLVAAIERRLGVTFKKKPIDDWSTLLDGLRDGGIALAPAIVDTSERRAYAVFTPAYIEIPLVIITSRATTGRMSLVDLIGLRVAVVRNYASAGMIRRLAGGRIKLIEVNSIQEGLRDVSFGVADAFVESVAVAAWHIEQEGLANLRVAGTLGISDNLSVGISKQYPLLASAVAKAMASVTPHELQTISRRWVKLETSPISPGVLLGLKLAGGAGSVLLLVLAALSWILRRRLKEKITALEQTKVDLADQVERFKMALQATNASSWEYHPDQDLEEHGQEWYTHLGYPPQDSPCSLKTWRDMIHPDDREQAWDTFMDFLNNGGQGLYETEFRMRAQNGTWRWMLGKGRTMSRDAAGKPTRIVGLNLDIDSQKKAQAAIAESEWRFRGIFENAPYSIVINRLSDGKYMDANTTALNRLGLDKASLLDKTLYEVGALPRQSHEHLVRELKKKRVVQNQETTISRADGSVGHILYSGALITLDGEPCVLSLPLDITDLKHAQEELRKSREMFARLFQLSPDMIALARQDDGTLIEINEAFTRFTGFSRDEALGRTTVELGMFHGPSQRRDYVAKLIRDRSIENFEFDIRHRDGRILKCSASARLLDMNDVPCILSITRDITHLRAMQDMMVQTEKMLSLGGIAAGIAHEINNPLGIVLQAVQTINLRLTPGHAKNQEVARSLNLDLDAMDVYLKARKIDAFLRDIEQAGIRAAGIVRHMLDFSRKSESRRAPCDITTVIGQALTLAASDYDLKKNYDFKSVAISQNFEADLPVVSCTETELEQVFLNLFRNAAHAMAEAGTPNPSIHVTAKTIPGHVRVEIEDNGPGIPEEHLSRVFEPFFTTKEPGAGTGLGLSVSYFIITKGHGGQMNVVPGTRGGTRFIVDLPNENVQLPEST